MKNLPFGRGLRWVFLVSLLTALLAIATAVPALADGTVPLTSFGVPYTQDFDILATTGISNTVVPTGWHFLETSTSANTVYRAGTGSDMAGDTYSFGADGSSERAFGGLFSNTLLPHIGAQLTNNTGGMITSLAVTYTGEQWRLGALGRFDRLDFQISTVATSLNSGSADSWINHDALDFTTQFTATVGAVNGNAPANRTTLNSTVTGLAIPAGASFWIRWYDVNVTGADDGLAIDDFSITPNGFVTSEEFAPVVTSTVPANTATNVAANADLTITFSEPVNVSGAWFGINCVSSGVHTATVSGGPLAFTLNPVLDFTFEESCTVTVESTLVTDQDPNDPPDAMPADYAFSFTVGRDFCNDSFTPIYTIQGTLPDSPSVGMTMTVEGVVTADFQGTAGMNGFFLQDPTGDGNVATSDGTFVFVPAANPLSAVDVAVGDALHVTGIVREFQGMTELDTVSVLSKCGTDTVAPVQVTLPETVNNEMERYEGMLVTIPGDFTVDQNYFQGRYGQVTISSGGRLQTPTNLYAPGSAEAVALAAENARRLLVLDDAKSSQNPNPIPYIGADNTLRAGDTVTGLAGVLDFGPINSNTALRDYRLQPTVAPVFTRANPRTPTPAAATSKARVAGANVLNYFNGDGSGGGFPTSRGATNVAEFTRQRTKVIAELGAINADVFGLMEIEKDTSGPLSAAQDLVNGLNDALGPGTYAVVDDPNNGFGPDEIKVALIYKPGTVTPAGASLSGNDAIFDRFPVAQTFTLNATGARFSVVVNHFKSKSSCPTVLPDPNADQGDGQGCWNAKRVQQAQALLTFMAQVKQAASDPDVLVIGDLNSYGMENPTTALTAAGLVNQIARFVANPYTYVFDGQAGYLDHALATAGLSRQVTGTTIWHANADEPSVIDYNTEFKPQDLYSPTPYRASDHDPVIVDLNLTTPTFLPVVRR